MTTKHSVGETLLCQHQGQMYEAKVKQVRILDSGLPEYFVHYAGWKPIWDEWVSDDRLVLPTPDNMAIQKALKDQARAKLKEARLEKVRKKQIPRATSRTAKPATARSLTPGISLGRVGKKSNAVGNGKRIKPTVIQEPTIINLADNLIELLVYDKQFVADGQKLVPLPRNPNLLDVLAGFEKWLEQNSGPCDAELAELQSGLIAFFDMALGTYLLYPFERCQYRDVLHDTNWKTLGSVYGAEHLLRLLSVLPALIDEHDLEKEQKNPLVNYCTDLATYLSLNIDTLFVKEYHNVNTAYTRLSTTS